MLRPDAGGTLRLGEMGQGHSAAPDERLLLEPAVQVECGGGEEGRTPPGLLLLARRCLRGPARPRFLARGLLQAGRDDSEPRLDAPDEEGRPDPGAHAGDVAEKPASERLAWSDRGESAPRG